MGNKKGLLITLIVIIVILILGVGGIGYAYIATDFLKSDEQLFYKYITQTGEKLTSFDSKQLEDYLTKTKQTPYESEGKLTVNVDMPGLNKEYADLVNGLNITFDGKTDNANQKAVQNIKINYSDDISFPITYKQTENIFGITSDLVIKKYIALKNENIEEAIGNLGILSSEQVDALNSAQNASEQKSPEMVINTLKRCVEILKENITKSNFSKTGNDAFTLTISDSKIVTKILDELENNSIITEVLRNPLEEELSSKTFKITVNKTNHLTIEIENTIMIGMQINDDKIVIIPTASEDMGIMTITIQKNETGNQLSYQISCNLNNEDEMVLVNLGMQYTNLESQTVRENYTLGLEVEANEETVAYDYTLSTSKKFVSKVDIEPLEEKDVVLLNNQTEEFNSKLFETVVVAIAQISTIQMQQLGVDVNPLIYATPLGIMMYQIDNTLNNTVTGNDINQAINDTEKVTTFNARFENYKGMQKGMVVQSLIQTVIESNESNPDNLVSINEKTNKEELTTYSSTINGTQTYNIIINKDDETGYVKTINIV